MKKTYTREFKEQACKLVVEDEIKPKIVAEKFGISEIMLYRWVTEYRTYGDEAFVGKGNQRSADAELKRMKKELEYLKAENEILKKAAAYFAKEHKND